MNKGLILLVFLSILSIQSSFGQGAVNHLDKEISIKLHEIELRDALPKIAEAGGFQFSYNAAILPGDSLVQLDVAEVQVEEVLISLLGPGLDYKMLGNHVIILAEKGRKSNKADRKIEYSITGYIYDAETGEIISEASVYEIEGMFIAATDQKGYYSLILPSDQEKRILSFSKNGYRDTLIVVRPKEQSLLDIQLMPKPEQPFSTAMEALPPSNIHQRTLVNAVVPGKAITASENIPVIEERWFQISLLPFIGSNRFVTGLISNRLSVNIFAGYSEGVRGLEVGGFLNIDRHDVKGVQLAGFGNIVGRNTNGVQMAGFFNINGGSFTGLQAAGFSNLVMDTIRGVQLAGFSNALRGPMYGPQISGFANFTSQSVDGMQISGFTNIAGKDVNVAQISGFANVAGKDVRLAQVSGFANYCKNVGGLQLAGFSNIASGTNGGLQVAGFLNYATELDGFQLGIFNISDTVTSGVPVGFLSFVRRGYHTLEFTADELYWANLSFKTGVRKFYNILTAGINNEWFHGGYGLGTQIRFSERFKLSMDLTSSYLVSKESPEKFSGFHTRFSPKLDVKLFKYLSITAGPSLNAFTNLNSSFTDAVELPLIASYPIQDKYYGDLRMRMWIGASVGIRL